MQAEVVGSVNRDQSAISNQDSQYTNAPHRRPRRSEHKGFLGNFTYKGGDKVCPGGWCMVSVSFIMIGVPSVLTLGFT
jgi:hypothetical protein